MDLRTSHTLGCAGNWNRFFYFLFIYYEQQIKRDLEGKHVCGCRCHERLKAKTDGSTCLGYTGLIGELEHLKIETRVLGESFESVMGECDLEAIGDPSRFKLIRSAAA